MSDRRILVQAFLAGAADLERRAALLDRINVFPVVDGDTGINMRQTLAEAVALLRRDRGSDLSELPSLLNAPLLKAARGNSGVIFSQFLVGFFDAIGQARRLGAREFADAATRGRDLAYRSVAEPVEGTILTAMTALARLLREAAPVDSLEAHGRLERQLAEVVARTPEQLPRLRSAGVVDAGALGFHLFASGLSLALPALSSPGPALVRIAARQEGRENAPIGAVADAIAPAFLASAASDVSRYRFCVNLLIELDENDSGKSEERFSRLGSSVERVQSGRLLKIHLHGDDVDAIRDAGAKMGKLLDCAVEDMTEGLVKARATSPALVRARSKLRVFGDSSMSLSDEVARRHCIERIENFVCLHGLTVRDSDLDRDELFVRMRQGHVYTTAQTSAEEVAAFFTRALAEAEQLLYVAVGNAYTGTQALARRVAAEHPEGKRIAICDTRAASGHQGLVCLAAAMRADASPDLGSLLAYAGRQAEICREYLVIDDLKFLSRTGRIGRIKAALAGALSLKPIVGHGGDGAITRAKVRSHKEALERIESEVAGVPGEGRLLVMIEHTDNLEFTREVMDRLRARLPGDAELLLSPLSSTSAVHMGPGTWGVAVTRI